ncbi:MAG: D-aminoacylase [Chloroflexi bacterium]|nr:D-aminoacylase [Chloroflexota bacterium]
MIDVLIKGGLVFDGSGASGKPADIAIAGDRIITIEPLGEAQAETVIDASGMAVTPGFIDMHSHGDFRLPFLPTADSKIHQGITLEVVGNCGSSMAPLSPSMIQEMNGQYQEEKSEMVVDWDSFGGYLDRLRRQGTSVNVVPLVGHGTIREKVMAMSDASPTPEQLAAMQDEVKRAMDEGAMGFTTGLIYTPNVYAGTEEIIALADTASQAGGLYTSHVRGEGDTLLEALHEAIEVGRRSEIPVQISHLKASGVHNWNKMDQALELIESARKDGLDVTADMYPYPASNTGLTSLIPAWVHVGGKEEMIRRLKDPSVRSRISNDQSDHVGANGVDWDGIFISSCPSRPDYEGRHVKDIATERKQKPLDAVMDLLIEARLNVDIIMFTMKEENVALGLRYPNVMIGSDSSGAAAEGPFSVGKPHPRNYGTFPRVLGRYSREQKLFPLEEAVRKMTGLPAGKLKLHQRGLLKPGYFADIVVFNPQTVIDTATFTQPHQYPVGIEWVLVNGKVVIANGKHTGARPGMVLSV